MATHDSIARVLDLLPAGLDVRIASGNVCDITSAMGTGDLLDEVVVARIAAAHRLHAADLARLRAHPDDDRPAAAAVADRRSGAMVRPE